MLMFKARLTQFITTLSPAKIAELDHALATSALDRWREG